MSATRFAIIGAGMSGILAAIKLRQAGHDHVTVYEKADRIGGTWRDNVYPGLSCDVPAHNYSFSFALNPEWSGYHASGPEIQAYFEKVVDDFGIRPLIRFNSEITAARWDGTRWQLEFADGTHTEAEVVIAATGVLHHPKIPDIPGLESFAGKAMHTARWEPELDLSGKRIGIIGSGSTGVQMTTKLGLDGHQIVNFQRSPQWIMPIPDYEYSEEELENFRNNPGAIEALRNDDFYWNGVYRFNEGLVNPDSDAMQEIETYCLQNLESVTDPVLREKLRPDYRAACKRLIYSSHYYEAAQLPNVETVVCGIDTVEPGGIRDREGTFHELDILALATGYHADRFMRPMVVEGTDGIDLETAWATRCSAYMAISIPHFPNLFMLNGPTSPVGNFSLIEVAEIQWTYVEQLIRPIAAGNATAVVASDSAFAAYEDKRIAAARGTIFASGCTSWYLDAEGVPMTWPWSYQDFEKAMETPEWEAYQVS
ncbi:MAG: NAD(P)/FAD-dependent oxidoreductase [Sphingomonadaceae bacterium]|nr:NAD(P)/FAD-dependent oxidoreductase [Sphingomonadaceae bacterium]